MHVLLIKPESLFQALSDSTRLRILRLLINTGEELCLCELVDTLNEPQYKLSRHLKVLRQAGLLDSQKEGRWVYHRLTPGPATGADHLKQLYALVQSLPDPLERFSKDLELFNQRLALRENGRCRVGILSSELTTNPAQINKTDTSF